MTLDELTQHTSPYLLCWIDLSIAPKHLLVPSDLKRVKRLMAKDFPVPHSKYTKNKFAYMQNFLDSRKGDWALLGEMTNLQVLEFPKRMPSGLIDDFSFLPKLKNLFRLDLQYTNFTDCSLLCGLTQLKYLALPARKKLIHTEGLDTISCEISMPKPAYRDADFPRYKTIPASKIPAPASGTFAVQLLEYGRKRFTNGAITQEVVEEMAKRIRKGSISSLVLAPDEDGEEIFFTMDIANGWAAPMFQMYDEKGEALCYQPINEAYDSVEEDAPVEIGGQSPVPKRFALNDLALAAECAIYFAKTGELYPGIAWAKFS